MDQSDGIKIPLEGNYLDHVLKFVANVRNEKVNGSYKVAIATVSLLEQIILEFSKSEKATALKAYAIIRECGQVICQALPQELVAANIVRRVLRGIRDEYKTDSRPDNSRSLQELVLATLPTRRKTLDTVEQDLNGTLRDYFAELRAELESSIGSICSTAPEHIHTNELILTYGASSITERFLKSCVSRKYRLIVAEGPCHKETHAMALRLSNASIPVTLISNNSIFGVMSRVNKVVIGVRAALAGGAVLASVGMLSVTAAAQHYSVPVIALTPLYKLSPLFTCDQQGFNALGAANNVFPYGELQSGEPHVYAPIYDLVPADHISLFITNIGGTSPSYIYRLLAELYDPKHANLLS